MEPGKMPSDLEPIAAVDGEPAFFGSAPSSEGRKHAPAICPSCGEADLVTEEAVDEEDMPTGVLIVTCCACGREVGELELGPPEESMAGGGGSEGEAP